MSLVNTFRWVCFCGSGLRFSVFWQRGCSIRQDQFMKLLTCRIWRYIAQKALASGMTIEEDEQEKEKCAHFTAVFSSGD